jgi:hypothetical protein
MTAPAHGDIQIALPAEFYSTLNIIRIHTADDAYWVTIDHSIPDPARSLVFHIPRQNQVPMQRCA